MDDSARMNDGADRLILVASHGGEEQGDEEQRQPKFQTRV